MTLLSDLKFALKPRCPVCREGKLFKPWSLGVNEECAVCKANLGANDVGDGAAVLLLFLLGFTLIPCAWAVERAFAPPLWVHVVFVGVSALALIALILPVAKAYIIMLEYRHRPGGWNK